MTIQERLVRMELDPEFHQDPSREKGGGILAGGKHGQLQNAAEVKE